MYSGFLASNGEIEDDIRVCYPKCFQVEGNKYKLSVPKCSFRRIINSEDLVAFRGKLADLRPWNARFQHALLNVTNLDKLHKHPVLWTKTKDLNFLVTLMSRSKNAVLLGTSRAILKGNWASHPVIRMDVEGDPKYWPKGTTAPKYDTRSLMNLGRYYRNKDIHFEELHKDLKALFKTRDGLLEFCNGLTKSGDLPFWEGVNNYFDTNNIGSRSKCAHGERW